MPFAYRKSGSVFNTRSGGRILFVDEESCLDILLNKFLIELETPPIIVLLSLDVSVSDFPKEKDLPFARGE